MSSTDLLLAELEAVVCRAVAAGVAEVLSIGAERVVRLRPRPARVELQGPADADVRERVGRLLRENADDANGGATP